MLQAKVVNKIKFPNVFLDQEDLVNLARGIIIPDIIRGIDNSKAIYGGGLPHNEPETIKRKGSNKPLIETGELRSSFTFKTSGKNKVIVFIDSGRSDIGGYLQKGIKTLTGIKQYLFFGISKDASDAAMRYLRNRIKEVTSGGK